MREIVLIIHSPRLAVLCSIDCMATKNTVTNNFPQSAEQIHAALNDAGFWDKLAKRFASAEGVVEKFESSEAGTTVVIRQTVTSDKLPSQATKFVKGDVSVARTFVISPLVDGTATATVTADASGIPVKFSANQKLEAAGGGSVLTTEADFAITVPLVGSMLEGKAAPYVEKAIAKEAEVLEQAAAQQG